MRIAASLVFGILAASACSPPTVGASSTSIPAAVQASPADLPNGDVAGAATSNIGAGIANPLAAQPEAIATGKRLFVQMNCAGCHGYDLAGAMGPNLTDRYWRYGGAPAAIYNSIASGHPQGMPAWRQALPPDQIWALVAYIQSFGGATAPQDYQSALQGDQPTKPASTGLAPGAQAGAKGGQSNAAQSATP